MYTILEAEARVWHNFVYTYIYIFGVLGQKNDEKYYKSSKLYKQVHLYMVVIGAKWGSIVYSVYSMCDTSIQRLLNDIIRADVLHICGFVYICFVED